MFKKSFLAIITLMAIIGFTFTACDKDDDGGGGIPVKIKFAKGTAPARSVARAVIPSDPAFTAYTEIYNSGSGKLGTKVGSGITPTSFKAEVDVIGVAGNNGTIGGMLLNGATSGSLVEFAGGAVTLNPGEAEPGTYDFVWVEISDATKWSTLMGGGSEAPGNSRVQFVWPAAAGDFAENEQMTGAGATIDGNTVTIRLGSLMPKVAGVMAGVTNGSNMWLKTNIYYGGSTGKLLNQQRITSQDIIPTYPETEIAQAGFLVEAIVVPFTPVNIPSSANAIVIELYWDINGIIEHYQGPDNTAGTADDIFVLKNGWWNALTISGYAEQVVQNYLTPFF